MFKIDPQTGTIHFGDIQITTTMKPEELQAYSDVTLEREHYEGHGLYWRNYLLPTVLIDNFKWQAYIPFTGTRMVATYFYCADILHHYGENTKAASIWWKIHAKWVEHATSILERQLGIGTVGLQISKKFLDDGKQYLSDDELRLFCDSLKYSFFWGEVYRFYHFKSRIPEHLSSPSPYDLRTTIWVQYDEMSRCENWNGLLSMIAEREQYAIDWRDEEAQQCLAAVHKLVNHVKNFVDYDVAQPHHISASLVQFKIHGYRYVSISLTMIGKLIQYEFKTYNSAPPRFTDKPDEIVSWVREEVERPI